MCHKNVFLQYVVAICFIKNKKETREKRMNKKLIFCVVLSLLIVLSGCASKSAETEEANVEIEAKATPNAMPEGMEPPEGMNPT